MTSTNQTEFNEERLADLQPRIGVSLRGEIAGRGVRVGIACARFNGEITTRLLEGALEALETSGVDRRDIAVAWVPGAYELPMLALAFADADSSVDAVIALGAVIRGDTPHFDFVAGEAARGCMDVQLSTRVPVVFGVLTTNNVEQALERSSAGPANKGAESARTALEMVSLLANGAFE